LPGISLTLQNTRFDEDRWADICDEVLSTLKDLTPVDTGLCRDSWEMDFDVEETTFTNDTEYASYLDEGWSDQAPDGMTGPLLAQLPSIVG
jgi:hypothetical protein